jgi:hypothetical protein
VAKDFSNGDLREKPYKKIAKLEVPVPNREEQASQQGGGASPQDQK